MVGLGTILLAIAALGGRSCCGAAGCSRRRAMLWALMLAFPFTYIANIAGWVTAETGRQPWVVYGLLRTEERASPAESVPAGTGMFTLLGFPGCTCSSGSSTWC